MTISLRGILCATVYLPGLKVIISLHGIELKVTKSLLVDLYLLRLKVTIILPVGLCTYCD